MNKALTELAWAAFALVLGFAIYSAINAVAPSLTDALVGKLKTMLTALGTVTH